ncbi:MAG TPA: ATP-binding protein [Streptosporangiaceae bacterium]
MVTRALGRAWARRPPATIRLRLTALYGGLFLAVGAVLLAITYGLFARQIERRAGPGIGVSGRPPPAPAPFLPPVERRNIDALREHLTQALAQQRADALHQLLLRSTEALGIVSVIAVALGWLMAGRVLRPLRDITATARRLSTDTMDERINLRGPRDEIKELADTFDEMLGRLAAAFEAQRRFVANASHELRTPLTVQRAAVDVALADPNPTVESLLTMGRRVRRAVSHHEHLIASLLTLARSERGVQRYEDVDLAVTVERALAAVRSDVDAVGLTVSSELRPSPVRGDPVLLERLAANLIDNAVRHNAPGGWIEVATAAGDRGTARLRVSNGGRLIPASMVGPLFEPFRRQAADRAADGQGHGLGLSIVAAITAAHRGAVAAAARRDGGLDVTVTLPAAPRGWRPRAGPVGQVGAGQAEILESHSRRE